MNKLPDVLAIKDSKALFFAPRASRDGKVFWVAAEAEDFTKWGPVR